MKSPPPEPISSSTFPTRFSTKPSTEPRYESSIVVGTKKFVKNNPETMQKFANAIVRAMIWINKNSNETVAKKAFAYFPDGSVNAKSLTYLRPSLSVDGFITPEGHNTIIAFCKSSGIIDRDIPYDEINDMSFIKRTRKIQAVT